MWKHPMDRAGVSTRTGTVGGPGVSLASAAAAGLASVPNTARSPLLDLFADFDSVSGGGAGALAVPAGTYTGGACYPFIDVEMSQDMAFFRAWGDLASCDVVTSDPVTYSNWGSRDGSGAAIVVGTDLFPAGTTNWVAASCPVPGVETGWHRSVRNNVFWWSSFPTGNLSDTIPLSRRPADSTAPQQRPLPRGSRFQAALWVRSTDVQTAADAGKSLKVKAMVGAWLTKSHESTRIRQG